MELDNGLLLHMANQKSQTRYIDYYLPATFTEYPGIETKVFSFAPVLEKEAGFRHSSPSRSGRRFLLRGGKKHIGMYLKRKIAIIL